MTRVPETTRFAVQKTVERIFLSDPSCARGYVLVDCLGMRPRILCTPGEGRSINQVARRAFEILGFLHPETSEDAAEGRYCFKATLDLDSASSHQRLSAHEELRRDLEAAGMPPDAARRLLIGPAEPAEVPHLP